MSRSNPLNAMARRILSRAQTVTSSSSSSSESGKENQKIPVIKERKMASEVPEMERDGYLLRDHPEITDGPDTEPEETFAYRAWEIKFDTEIAGYDALSAKARAVEQGNVPVRNSENQRKPRASMNISSMQSLTLGTLAGSRWLAKTSVKFDEDNFPLLDKVPAALRRALANEYREFAGKITHANLSGAEREEELRQALAKKFLAWVLMGPDSQFDKSKIGSLSAINQYLSKHFGLQIISEPVSSDRRAELPSSPQSPRAPRSSFSGWLSSSSSSSAVTGDFRDLLVQDAVYRSRNYQVDYSLPLSDLGDDSFEKKVIDGEIEANKKHEKVGQGQRTDLTNIFQRDFKKSTYEYEATDGTIVKLDSFDEFVKFIGDPLNTGLPKVVSAYATQTLGIIIKNLLFGRKDAKGNLQSPVKLFDGTLVNFSAAGAARYRFKKGSDGSVTLHYRSEIDTGEASKTGKAAAKLILSPDGSQYSARSVDHAKAVMTLDIVFQPDGSARLGTLNLHAEGWNLLNE